MPAVPVPRVEDPTWWRLGSVPFLVLVMVAAGADFMVPRGGTHPVWEIGIGSGIGSVLLAMAILFLRKDLTSGQSLFLVLLSAVNFLALSCSGMPLNWFCSLVLPLLMLGIIPYHYADTCAPGVRFRSWWGFWIARREKGKVGCIVTLIRSIFPFTICAFAGAVCFILFLTIFAADNPVVKAIWDQIVDKWNELVSYFHISWDFAWHVLYWILGIIVFGFYTFRRCSPQPQVARSAELPAGRGVSLLPLLPFFVLLGSNLAFAIVTYTDITYLWFNNIPSGISKTQYLYEGATSISWASFLASLILLFFFRARGSVRTARVSAFLGYVLLLQTILLAGSVCMRLYFQISDHGFTPMRIMAAESILLGVAGLLVLFRYMLEGGYFWVSVRKCVGLFILLLLAFCICTPGRLAGSLNLRFVGSHPQWKFSVSDFYHPFNVSDNLAFAEYVASSCGQSDLDSHFMRRIREAALAVERRAASGTWLDWTLSFEQDIPAAERILGRPIKRCSLIPLEPGEMIESLRGESVSEASEPMPDEGAVDSSSIQTVPDAQENMTVDFSDTGVSPDSPGATESSSLELSAPEQGTDIAPLPESI